MHAGATLYHIAHEPEWDCLRSPGASYLPDSASAEGFIHCCYWDQLSSVAKRYFRDRTDVVVAEMDAERLGASVRMERAPRAAESYPHVYGAIPVSAATGELELRWLSGGEPQIVRWPNADPSALELVRAEMENLELLTLLNLQLREDEGYQELMDRREVRRRMAAFITGHGGHQVYCLVAPDGPRDADRRIVGYATVNTDRTPLCLRQLFVLRGMRGRGFGSRAVELLRTEFHGEPMEVEALSRNARAVSFWRQQGFDERYVGLRWPGTIRRSDAADGAAGVTMQVITGTTTDRSVHHANAFILDRLKSYNARHSEHLRRIHRLGAVREIVVMLTEADQWIGGVRGSVYWDWLDIRYFWIDERLRGQGHGSAMLAELERLAREDGARRARLSTFSFQAKDFYLRHGYGIVGELTDFPPGESLYWMRKELV